MATHSSAQPGSGKATTEDKVHFLSSASAYRALTPVEVQETHMAWVFLAGDRAYKLKKPVKYAFLDFSTLEAREHVCREELRLNRRLAPDTYLDVVPLTQDASGKLAIGGKGPTVDWLVKMRRLPANRMLDHLILQGEITPPDIDALSGVLSSFYKGVAPMPLSAEDYLHVFVEEHEENRRILLQVDHNLPREELELIFAAIESALAARHLIASRAETHRIVDGHGDLRPEHVCLIDPTVIIDCLEFNPRLRMVDPFDELAYLGME